MTTTAFLQLRRALAAHLAVALAPVTVYQNRVRPLAQGEASAVNVRLSDASGTTPVIEATDWNTILYIDCAARGANADDDADALLNAVFSSLSAFATSPAAQDASVLEVIREPVIDWDRVSEDTPYTCASLRITAVHRTPAGSLQPWGAAP